MHAKNLNEETIVNKAIAGDSTAFGDLYERYLDSIYHYVYYRVDNREEAEDLTEIVFLKVWQALPKYPPEKISFRLWLYRIANHAVIDHYRTRKETLALDAADTLRDPVAGPETTLAEKERINALKKAIRELSDDQQQVVICRFILGLSHAETAAVLDKSEEATRALQYRAIGAIKQYFLIMEGSYV